MPAAFHSIAIIGMPRHKKAIQTHRELYHWLIQKGHKVNIEQKLSQFLTDLPQDIFQKIDWIKENCQLAIVVGGDGNMLGAARMLSTSSISVIGMNRGNLGFLTDLNPEDFQKALTKVLGGEYFVENRFLLEVEISRKGVIQQKANALNEAVLHPGKVAHMIEFEVYIDDKFAFSLRSDGLIIATPTGSTAYSLSGGGPILSPSLNVISLVPMYPHSLSSRPLVVDGFRKIRLVVAPNNKANQKISCDGQAPLPVLAGDEIHIYQSPKTLQLIHPIDYNYYEVLRHKLGWSNKLF